jgi:hypothetical protein
LQSLKDLERQFASFGIKFFCFYGQPEEVLEKLIKVILVKNTLEIPHYLIEFNLGMGRKSYLF